MNKQLAILILVLLSAAGLKAQVSINQDNSSPNPSAMLDVKSSDKGMLVPRMTSIQRNAIASPATGLLVFDETTGGFWFYNGTVWQNLSADGDTDPANELQNLSGVLAQGNDAGGAGMTNLGAVSAASFSGDGSGLTNLPPGNDWGLNGNAGTDPATHFIGTSDDVPLIFRVNNTPAFRLEYASKDNNWLSPNIIGGFSGNTIATGMVGGTIGGGGFNLGPNTISADFATISGGFNNNAGGNEATVSGGANNIATGVLATVSGGELNSASSTRATVSGGGNNSASGYSATVSGGTGNLANGTFATVCGGVQNLANGEYSTVMGGYSNIADGDYSLASGNRAKINGAHNGAFLFSDQHNFDFNSAAANEFAVRATGGVRFVTAIDGSGNPAQTLSIDSTGKVTAAAFAGDGSGLTNVPMGNGWRLTGNSGTDTTINFIGTTDNMPLDFRVNNTRALRLEYAEFLGNPIPNFISGASDNWVSNGIYGATIVGGGGPSQYALSNRVTGNLGTIVGGVNNSAEADETVVIGGQSNHATKYVATIVGGDFNRATGEISTILGGEDNNASGRFSTVLGGNYNTAAGFNSLAAGRHAKANHDGSFVLAAKGSNGIDHDFVSIADEEFAVLAKGGLRFVTAIDGSGNPTKTVSIDNTGTVSAAAFVGDGSGLTGITDADNQTLSLNGTDLSILNGNSVNLSGINTDNQTLSLSGAALSIQNGNSINLSGINTDHQTLNLSGASLSIQNGNSVNLSGINTDNQTLSLSGASLGIEDGNSVDLSGINTDDQTLSLSGTTLSIENGNSVDFSSLGIVSDNLGNHTATQNIKLNGHYLSGDGGNEGIFVDASGKVGIGDNTPVEALDVSGNSRFSNDNPEIVFFEDGAPDGTRKSVISNRLSTILGQGGAENQQMIFKVSNGTNTGMTSVMTLQGDGKVGIGTTTPQERLHILGSGGTKLQIEESSNEFAGVVTSNSQHNYFMGVTGPGDGAPDNWHLYDNTADAARITVKANGNVGIGTTNPLAPLHVNSTTNIASFSGANNGGAWMYEASGAGSDEIGFANAAGSTDVSIYASGSIVADGEGVFVAATVNWSDERIKHIEGVSDAKKDLETLKQIEITDYRRIDGGKREKKVIAQQLRKVFPQAVSLREGVIPSIYEHIQNFSFDEKEKLLTIETTKPHGLKSGDRIDYYTETGKFDRQAVVAVLAENVFQVKAEAAPSELFVYGKWVDDVHTVDYDAISMLNVSAAQEQQRIIEAQGKRIAELEAQNTALKTEFEQRLSHLEAFLQTRAVEDNTASSSEK